MKKGNWLVLARTKFMLNDLEDKLYSQGLYYENKLKKQRTRSVHCSK